MSNFNYEQIFEKYPKSYKQEIKITSREYTEEFVITYILYVYVAFIHNRIDIVLCLMCVYIYIYIIINKI